jgi:hypothetical protein
MSQPYLFYSERCPNSKQIIETLKALNKAGLYKFVLVDTLPRDKIPEFLKKVPTLYVPETKDVIIGKDIYGFIAKPTNSRKEVATKDEGPAAGTGIIGDLSAWGFEGTDRLSESYSLWNAPTQFAAEGGSFYTFLDGSAPMAGAGSGMPSDSGPVTKNTIDKTKSATNADVLARMEQMTNQRKSEFSAVDRK